MEFTLFVPRCLLVTARHMLTYTLHLHRLHQLQQHQWKEGHGQEEREAKQGWGDIRQPTDSQIPELSFEHVPSAERARQDTSRTS
jgi:hypothetical protein